MEMKGRNNALFQSENGFTLIELVLSLFIFLVIASMLPLAVRTFLDDSLLETGIKGMEWEVFSSQAKKEIRTADELTVLPDKILMKVNGKMVVYERYGTNLRRRVDYQGHEILIQNISTFQFSKIADGVELLAIDTNGRERIVRFQKMIETGEVVP